MSLSGGSTSATSPSRSASAASSVCPVSKEIAPAIHSQEQRIDDVHAVAGHDLRREMRGILELRSLGRQDDVAQQGDLRVAPRRTVDRADHRYLDVQQVHQEMTSLPMDAIDPLDRRD